MQLVAVYGIIINDVLYLRLGKFVYGKLIHKISGPHRLKFQNIYNSKDLLSDSEIFPQVI